METAAGDVKGANNNKQKEHISWVLYIWKYRCAHCNDLAVYGLHNPHVCWEMRYPEIHQNKISQCSYWFSDPHRMNPIQHNNQLIYESIICWLFWVENHFIKCYVVICCLYTYKIWWTKLRCLSLHINCMMLWLSYTIWIYSNNTKQEINMIINSSIYDIVILFNCSHHVHVILKNPSGIKRVAQTSISTTTGTTTAAIDP